MTDNAPGYLHDIFLSYPRNSFVEGWVRKLLLPTLEAELAHVLPDREPQIFIDSDIRAGECWPAALRDALLRSRCLIAVWSAQYFRSRWCLAEWRSMHARTAGHPKPRLVLPLIVRDGANFPEEAQLTQAEDFKGLCWPHETLRHNHPDAMRFYREVQRLAEQVVLPALLGAPTWSPHFPIETPEPVRANFDLRRL